MSSSFGSRAVSADTGDDEDSLWGFISFDSKQSEYGDSSDDGSMVMVSRTSSPSPVEFMKVQTTGQFQLDMINWPSTLPFFQFQAIYSKQFAFLRSNSQVLSAPIDLKTQQSLLSAATGSKNPDGVLRLFKPESLDAAAREMTKLVPEREEGEHRADVGALVSGDPLQAKQVALRLFVYRVSNNLIEPDPDEDFLEELKFDIIVRMFRDLGLPFDMWVRVLSSAKDDSSRAFIERVFESAVGCADEEVMEAMLKSGADPDQLCLDVFSIGAQRPIQAAAHRGSVKMVELLLSHGADVDGTTEDEEMTALHIASSDSAFEMVRVLVEHGADLYVTSQQEFYEPVAEQSALVFQVAGNHNRRRPRRNMEEDRSTKTFQYLLDRYRRSPTPWRNGDVFQDALIMAANRHFADFIRALVDAGASVTQRPSGDVDALEAAAQKDVPTTSVVSLLIGLGAPVNRRQSKLSALHIAAGWGHDGLVQLLVDNGALIDASTRLNSHSVLNLPFYFRCVRDDGRWERVRSRYWTPLQLSLHNEKKDADTAACKSLCALILLSAGARLWGGELAQAASLGNPTLIQALLDRGANPNEANLDGLPALTLAVSTGNQELFSLLMNQGARMPRGILSAALETGKTDLVEAVLSRGAKLDDAGKDGASILEAACRSGCYALLKECAEKQGNTIRYDPGALCAVVFACKTESDGDKNGGGETETKDEWLSLLDQILQLRADSPMGKAPVVEGAAWGIAAYRRNRKVLDRLFQAGHVPRTCLLPVDNTYSSFYYAAGFGPGLKYNYEEGSKFWHQPDRMQCSTIMPAVLAGDWGLVRRFLAAGCRPDPLTFFTAVASGYSAERIDVLIAHGANVNAAPRYDVDTPLQLAARRESLRMVRLLLDRGADVNALPSVLAPPYQSVFDEYKDPNPWRPRSALQAAVERGDVDMATELLAAGARVDGPVSQDAGASALQLAAAKGFMGLAKMLLEAGADVNAPRAERHGRTALEGAAEAGKLDMVHFLVENGAEIGRPGESESGRWGLWQYHRAIGFARSNGHTTVAKMLTGMRPWDRADRRKAEDPDLLDEIFDLDKDEDEGIPDESSEESSRWDSEDEE